MLCRHLRNQSTMFSTQICLYIVVQPVIDVVWPILICFHFQIEYVSNVS